MLQNTSKAMMDDLKQAFIDREDRRNRPDSNMRHGSRIGASPKEEPEDTSYLNQDLLSDDEADESPASPYVPSYRAEHEQVNTSVSPRTSSHRSRRSLHHQDNDPIHNVTTRHQTQARRGHQDASSTNERHQNFTAPRTSLMYSDRLAIAIDFGTTYTGNKTSMII
jgi:hypothetical protein